MTRRYAAAALVLGITARGGPPKEFLSLQSSYNAAIYIGPIYGVTGGSPPRLEVFTIGGAAFAIPLPIALGTFEFSPDGKALYATASFNPLDPRAGGLGLLKIEFNPVRATPIPGSDVFGIMSFAVSAQQGKLLISGNRLQAAGTGNGLFELDPESGDSRLLMLNDKTEGAIPVLSRWSHLSVSPDGTRAAAMRNGLLEVIDLTRHTVTPLPQYLEVGAWSPDGKWLAAIDWKKGHTVLLDAATLTPKRVLEESDVEWSPDSRFLLGARKYDLCGPYSGTLQIIDVESGKRLTLWHSRCKVNQPRKGWLSADVLK